MSGETTLLEMKGMEKSFPGVKALDNACLTLRAGTVHALMGENGAGKSTLMKCLFGIYKPDAGEILVSGTPVRFSGPKDAMEHGVSMVHQELNQVLKRSVMENLWLGRFPKRFGLVSHKEMFERTRAIFEELGIDVNPKAIVGKLSVSQRQMIEIAKAVSYNAKILVLDEPTSSLTNEEVEHLFTIINKLRDSGVGIIYISHKMEEILKISDEVTVMRDGQWIGTEFAADLTVDRIIKMMVGRDLTHRFPPKTNVPSEEILLAVENLTGTVMPGAADVSFSLRRGEILGVAGLVGSRRTELLESIFGIRHAHGRIEKDGRPIQNRNATEAIKNGFALLTEERRATGIFAGLDVMFNAVIANINSYKEHGLLSSKGMQSDTQWVIDNFKVKTPSRRTFMRNLSGGNQQKVIIGRWLLTKPDVLLLDEPTRGIDVGAKAEIYQLIIDLAAQGKGIVVVSSEMPELLGITDRILVMSGGRVAGVLETKDATQEEIMRLAAKYV